MGPLALYRRYASASLRAQMAYPGAFITFFLSNFLATGVGIVGIWGLFARFHRIRGWSFDEVAFFYAVASIVFSFADVITRGFDVFGERFVKTGDFDRILLRPRSTILQLSGYEFRLAPFGRMAQGLIVLAVALALLPTRFDLSDAVLLLWAGAGGVALFFAILVLQATLAFYTVESLEIANTLTYGGVEAAQYPLDIYASWFRNFLIFVVPIGCVLYFPVAAALHRTAQTGAPVWIAGLAPFAGFIFLAGALLAWRAGVRRYTSTGS